MTERKPIYVFLPSCDMRKPISAESYHTSYHILWSHRFLVLCSVSQVRIEPSTTIEIIDLVEHWTSSANTYYHASLPNPACVKLQWAFLFEFHFNVHILDRISHESPANDEIGRPQMNTGVLTLHRLLRDMFWESGDNKNGHICKESILVYDIGLVVLLADCNSKVV